MPATLIIFVGGFGGSAPEQMVAGAHRAIALDTIERARDSGAFSSIIVATDSEDLAHQLKGRVEVDLDQGPFHFGERLRQIIARYRVSLPFYLGGGLPLLDIEELGGIALQLEAASETVITNNLYSSDLVAFTPGRAIEKADLPTTDNPLAQALVRAGLKLVTLPLSLATIFDVDTPTDLMVLELHPGAGPRARAYLDSLDLDLSRLRRALACFSDVNAEVLVAGRVGSYLWPHLERDTACRVRTLAEERGMRADGRDERGEARSILGLYLEQVGVRRFFQDLGQLGQAAFIDSRVIFAHRSLRPTAADRFNSDLGRLAEITDPFIREFTQGALEAPIPVVLGGHSLVAGGLLALIEVVGLQGKEGV
jgi:2-phospho-L-lactate guanylyltransferase (CobY/MobA/RfbA family)